METCLIITLIILTLFLKIIHKKSVENFIKCTNKSIEADTLESTLEKGTPNSSKLCTNENGKSVGMGIKHNIALHKLKKKKKEEKLPKFDNSFEEPAGEIYKKMRKHRILNQKKNTRKNLNNIWGPNSKPTDKAIKEARDQRKKELEEEKLDKRMKKAKEESESSGKDASETGGLGFLSKGDNMKGTKGGKWLYGIDETWPGTTAADLKADSEYAKNILKYHNKMRKHCSKDTVTMKWDESIAKYASDYAKALAGANSCGISHSFRGRNCYDDNGTGENLAMVMGGKKWTTKDMSARNAVNGWGGEGYKGDATGSVTGHYTAMMWKNNTAVGCGMGYNPKKKCAVTACNYRSKPLTNMGGSFDSNMLCTKPIGVNLEGEAKPKYGLNQFGKWTHTS